MKKFQLVDVVPYQKCPLCDGSGETIADGFINGVTQTCKVCKGERIIPMATLNGINWRIEEN